MDCTDSQSAFPDGLLPLVFIPVLTCFKIAEEQPGALCLD